MFLALRLPEQVDVPSGPSQAAAGPHRRRRRRPDEARFLPERGWAIRSRPSRPAAAWLGPRAWPGRPHPARTSPPPFRPGAAHACLLAPIPVARPPEPGGRAAARWRGLGNVGPVVGEAIRANAVLRAFSGYMVFFLAFFLRTENFSVSHNFALGALVAAAAAGGLAAMAIGSLIKSRAPQFMLFAMLTLAPIVTATCAWFFSLTAAIAVAFTAALAAGLAKLSLDSTVQREIGEEIRSSAFAVSETLNQVANVAGSVAGVLVSMLDNGEVGLAIAAAFLAASLVSLVARRRRRILAARADEEYVPRAQPRRPRVS